MRDGSFFGFFVLAFVAFWRGWLGGCGYSVDTWFIPIDSRMD